MVAEYVYYDSPLLGVFAQGDQEFLFYCWDGHLERISLWWYVAITPEQRAAVEAIPDEDFATAIRSMDFHGWSLLALATTNLGIVDSEPVHDSSEGAASALDALKKRFHALQEDADRLTPAYA